MKSKKLERKKYVRRIDFCIHQLPKISDNLNFRKSFLATFLHLKSFLEPIFIVVGYKCFSFTFSSTSDIDKSSITSDFGRYSLKRGTREIYFLTIDAVNLDKIDQIR